jgi:TolB-like protein
MYVRKDYDGSKIRKVAVFSFHNQTRAPDASKIVTAAFMAGVVEMRKFQVEFPGNVRSFLVRERIIVRTGIDLETVSVMGKRLGVDAVILGVVEEYVGTPEATGAVVPVVSISSRMVDTQTGRILWMAQHRRTGDDYLTVLDFGKVRSVGALTNRVVGEMIATMP